ncbi:hypothetical protein [Microbulbifer sp. TRSA002]|uniref:hypothetical protein n=1 Tax=Microbulbifer sp. TRSA002 TaxID=3243382 RepID=UPI00403A6139
MSKGAMTIAEGDFDCKTDVSLILNGSMFREFVLRTTFNTLDQWKSKYKKGVSPFHPKGTPLKDAAVVDEKELWVFGVDANNVQHLVDSVRIACWRFNARPADFISSVYVKNLNVEGENEMDTLTRIKANEGLYKGVTSTIIEAAKILGVTNEVNFYIYSASKNYKIPKAELHSALKGGGAQSVKMDSGIHFFKVGSNDGSIARVMPTNLHHAVLLGKNSLI